MKGCISKFVFAAIILSSGTKGVRKDSCGAYQFLCNSGKCIQQMNVCDNVRDCTDGEDELAEMCLNVTSECWSWQRSCGENGTCRGNSFQCDNGKCIKIQDGCNRIDDCGDGSDERRGLIGFKCAYKGGADRCNVPKRLLNDGIVHCENKLDEYAYVTGDEKYFECFDQSHNISIAQLCDVVIDCPDLSDECPCGGDRGQETEQDRICSHYCLPFNKNSGKNCTLRTLSCDHDRKEIELKHICDGIRDCNDAMDERFCGHDSTLYKEISCVGNIYGTEYITAKECDGIPECFDLSDECKNCPGNLPPFCKLRPKLRSDGHYHYKCNTSTTGQTYSFTAQDICNGFKSPCEPMVYQEELGCRDRFYCRVGGKRRSGSVRDGSLPLTIADSLKCDGLKQCKQGFDEDNCTNRYACDRGPPYSVPVNYVSDGNKDCVDGSDECPRDLNNKFISSRDNMIDNVFLNVWVWLVGIIVLIANGFVVVTTCRQLYNTWHKAKNVTKNNLLMIANLASADFIMGIYLIAVAILSQLYAGRYCQVDLHWRTTDYCSILGSLSVISSQMSIFMLLTIATVRMVTLLNPLTSQYFRVRWTVLCIVLLWVLTLLIAYTPMSKDLLNTFTTRAFIPSKFNKNSQLTLQQTINFIKHLEDYITNSSFHKGIDTWSEIDEFLKSKDTANNGCNIIGKFGYYSRHAICVPDYYLTSTDEGWKLPTAIVAFNFFAFIYLPVIYLIIYKKTSKSRISTTTAPDRSHEMQRKMIKLVVSDFLCWMPICIIALLRTFGAIRPITSVLYAVTAIIILPINSVLNPLLYTDAFEILWKNTYKLAQWTFKNIRIRRKSQLLPKVSDDSDETEVTQENLNMKKL